MNDELARRILGVTAYATQNEIKKQYRIAMRQAHPDNDAFSTDQGVYDASMVNAAYTYLIDHYKAPRVLGKAPVKQGNTTRRNTSQSRRSNPGQNAKNQTGTSPNHEFNKKRASQRTISLWNAPQNPRAYADRPIFQHAEDMEHNVIGNYYLCHGKYYWTKGEDFLLFLQSIMQCAKELLDQIDEDLDRETNAVAYALFQSNLVYLLAQQFIDTSQTLKELSKESGQDKEHYRYRIQAMLEYTSLERANATTRFLPAGVRQHKLYICNETGKELGYLSFFDDRLYYVLIPLFEQKTVQVKMSLGKSKTKSHKYEALDLWIRIPKEVSNRLPENLNLQIEKLLEAYETFTS